MSNLTYALVLFSIFLTSLIASLLIIHLAAISYDNNVNLIPRPDPNCNRYLVQFSEDFNLNTEVAFLIVCINKFQVKILHKLRIHD